MAFTDQELDTIEGKSVEIIVQNLACCYELIPVGEDRYAMMEHRNVLCYIHVHKDYYTGEVEFKTILNSSVRGLIHPRGVIVDANIIDDEEHQALVEYAGRLSEIKK